MPAMKRALVLGGGGPVGVAWESGILAGLADAGADVSDADFIVGTSAGSIVGSQLALGRTPRQLYERQAASAPPGRRANMQVDMQALIKRFMRLYTEERPLQELRAEMGAYALEAATIGEEEWLAGFTPLEGVDADAWPERPFACTAIDTADGSFVVWDRASGVPLRLAVASSCAVPGVMPPVTINGRRYMDGGVGSATNATIACGYDRVLIFALTGGSSARSSAIADIARRRFDAELDALGESGAAVDVVRPNDEFVQKVGVNLMDFTRRIGAADIGLRQGAAEAERVRAFWR
jgi:NTE family protein